MQQYRHYQATMEVFRLHPDQSDKNLEEIVMFLAQVKFVFMQFACFTQIYAFHDKTYAFFAN